MSTIEDLITDLPQNEKEIVRLLRSIILSCSPSITEKLSYNVPFFYDHSRICFIWPGSVPWGKKTKEGVELGMCRGNLLSNEQGLLKLGERKEVSIVTFYSVKEIDADAIREIISEAVILDEMMAKKKN